MARSIHWKEKVALNVLLLSTIFILTFINVPSAIAQVRSVKNNGSGQRGITYSCRATRFESVMDHLAKTTGYDFIYSPNLIDISRPVSLVVNDKPINEVLSLIEQQVNVSFKLQERHIIVKSNPKPAAMASRTTTERSGAKVLLPSFKSSDGLLVSSVGKSIPLRPQEGHADLLQDHLDRRINELQALLGPGVPKNIPPFYINQINFNNRHRGWFGAVGTFAGDNSSGIEFQAGLPYLYAVYHRRWTMDQGSSGAYGIGNSFNLTGNFSFNAIYMYSGQAKTESEYPFGPPSLQMGPEFRRTEVVRHHQVKMAVQYAFSKKISLRAGPVLNYLNTARQFSVISSSSYPEGNFVYRQTAASAGGATAPYQPGQIISVSRITRTQESWLGWEASITYRIIFFPRQ